MNKTDFLTENWDLSEEEIKVIGKPIKSHNLALHSNTLRIIENNHDDDYYLLPTQFYINRNVNRDKDNIIISLKLTEKDLINEDIPDDNQVKKFMEIPNLTLPSKDLLYIYGCYNYEVMLLTIKKIISNSESRIKVYRIVNLYTRTFFKNLKENYNTLIKIFKIIFSDVKIDNINYDEFFNNWFKNNSEDIFDLNICKDFKKFLSNKYGLKNK